MLLLTFLLSLTLGHTPPVHDPVMAMDGNTYYIYSTGMGLSVMSSTDLENWTLCPSAFTAPPAWAIDSVKGYRGHTWAPDIVKVGDTYHLYYSCSTFGKNTSAIGHAWSKTLATNDTLSPWHDTGLVIVSKAERDNFNAIDPAVIIDSSGTPWMTFGSFWGGIQLIRLTDDMAHRDPNYPMRVLAARPHSKAIEAPFIYSHGGWFYLFVSWDYCCRGALSNYKVVVGRSRHIDGPYLDRKGRDMAKGGGTLVYERDANFVAGGHCAAYTFGGRDLFIGHGYTEHESLLVMRDIKWVKGWPQLILK